MKTYETINDILVHLFNEIWELEKNAIITEEFKDITNNDMHIIEAIGLTYRHHAKFHEQMTNAVIEELDETEIPVLLKTLRGLDTFFRSYSDNQDRS